MKIITIGRNPGNDIVINDGQVSKTHCQMVKDDFGNVKIMDMNSLNGTYVNGQRVKEKNLTQSDIIRIGSTTLPWQSYFSNPTIVSSSHSNRPNYVQEPQKYVNVNQSSQSGKPKSLTVWAVLCLIFCSVLFGILALVYNNKVDKLWDVGNYDEANDCYKKAKIFCWVSLGLFVFRFMILCAQIPFIYY